MVRFLDPETAEILQFLDPEIVKMDKKNSGSRNRRNGVISGSRNRRKGRQILYDSTLSEDEHGPACFIACLWCVSDGDGVPTIPG